MKYPCLILAHAQELDRTFFRNIDLPFVPHKGMGLLHIFNEDDEGIIIESVLWNMGRRYFEVQLEGMIDRVDRGNGLHPDWRDLKTNKFPADANKERIGKRARPRSSKGGAAT